MKWPDKLNLCKNCSGTTLTPWFKNKLEEFVDMDYPYSSFRPSLLVCARKDLCPDCAKKVIECADRINEWKPETKVPDEASESGINDETEFQSALSTFADLLFGKGER